MASSAELSILIRAQDEASKTLEKIADNTDNLAVRSGAASAAFNVAFGLIEKAAEAVAGAFVSTVGKAAEFEAALSAIKAVTGASAEDMEKLGDVALQLGKDTSFSAKEAADAIGELAKGGVSVADIMGGAAAAALDLAAASGADVAEAAALAANAMSLFNLTGADTAKVVDQIAGFANATTGDMIDFKFALQSVGAAAALSGQEFEQTATAIALMGKAGILGSDAGTSLKTMLLNLQPTTENASEAFRQLGITIPSVTGYMQAMVAQGLDPAGKSLEEMGQELYKSVTGWKEGQAVTEKMGKAWKEFADQMGLVENRFIDANGEFKDLRDIAAILNEGVKDLTESEAQLALKMAFGNDAIRAAAILAEAGAEGFDEMAEAMNNVSAAAVATERLDNLNGSLEAMGGSMDTLQIIIGRNFLPVLKELVDDFTVFLNTIVIPWAEQHGPAMAAAAAEAARHFKDFLGVVVPFVAEHGPGFLNLIQTMAPLIVGVGTAFVAWQAGVAVINAVTAATALWTAAQLALNVALTANPIGIIVVALAGLTAALIVAYNTNEDFRRIVNAAWSNVQEVTGRALEVIGAALVEIGRVMSNLPGQFGETGRMMVTVGEQANVLGRGMAEAAIASRQLVDAVTGAEERIRPTADALFWMKDSVAKLIEAAAGHEDVELFAKALNSIVADADTAKEVEAITLAVNDLIDSVADGSVTVDEALDRVTQSFTEASTDATGALADMSAAAETESMAVASALVTNIEAGVEDTGTALDALDNLVEGSLFDAKAAAEIYAPPVGEAASEGIAEGIGVASGLVYTAADTVLSEMGTQAADAADDYAKPVGAAVDAGIVAGIDEGQGTITAQASATITAAAGDEDLKSNARTAGGPLGSSLIDGLLAGARAKIEDGKTALGAAVLALVNHLRGPEVLNIQSPSRKTYTDLGEPAGEGTIKGWVDKILDGKEDVADAFDEVVKEVKTKVEPLVTEIAEPLDTAFDGLNTTVGKVRGAFNELNTTFGEIRPGWLGVIDYVRELTGTGPGSLDTLTTELQEDARAWGEIRQGFLGANDILRDLGIGLRAVGDAAAEEETKFLPVRQGWLQAKDYAEQLAFRVNGVIFNLDSLGEKLGEVTPEMVTFADQSIRIALGADRFKSAIQSITPEMVEYGRQATAIAVGTNDFERAIGTLNPKMIENARLATNIALAYNEAKPAIAGLTEEMIAQAEASIRVALGLDQATDAAKKYRDTVSNLPSPSPPSITPPGGTPPNSQPPGVPNPPNPQPDPALVYHQHPLYTVQGSELGVPLGGMSPPHSHQSPAGNTNHAHISNGYGYSAGGSTYNPPPGGGGGIGQDPVVTAQQLLSQYTQAVSQYNAVFPGYIVQARGQLHYSGYSNQAFVEPFFNQILGLLASVPLPNASSMGTWYDITQAIQRVGMAQGVDMTWFDSFIQSLPHFAGGGRMAVVGERGPELVTIQPMNQAGGAGFDYDRMADANVRALQRYGLVATIAPSDLHRHLVTRTQDGTLPFVLSRV